ncbi:MAG TPA: hypothetical protein VFV47_04875, partial [Hyphomicrobiaceae bacterium]|nr:hypothetical protein [Hyphomicrobiaceae bacterium]
RLCLDKRSRAKLFFNREYRSLMVAAYGWVASSVRAGRRGLALATRFHCNDRSASHCTGTGPPRRMPTPRGAELSPNAGCKIQPLGFTT